MAIDWSLAKQPDFVGNAYAAQRQGQQAGIEQGTRNAYAQYAQDPEAGIKQLMQYDPAAATQLATGRRQEKRQDAADAVALDDRQKKAASERAGMLASYAQSLKAIPDPAARKAKLAQDAPQLIQRGLTAEMINGFDPSDQNIDQVTSDSLGLKDKLDLDLKNATFKAGRADQQFDQTFKTNQFGETVRHNKVDEGQGSARLGLEGQRVAIARQSEGRQAAAAERAAQGRQIPGNVKMGYAANSSNITQIDDALSELKKRPNSVGLSMSLGDAWNQRTDKDGITARAAIANIGSLIIHDRSGAAVTISESPRLMPFIPTVVDTPDAARKKLTALKRQIQNQNAEIETAYDPSNGYTPLGGGAQAAPATSDAPSSVLRFDARGNRIK